MSDNDIDAELLALVEDGDSASENEASKVELKESRSLSPEVVAPSPGRSPQRKSRLQKGVARKPISRTSRASGARQRVQDDSEEEGQASDHSSHKSLGSGAMSESESDGEPNAIDTKDERGVFPLEGKFYSSQDKAEIMAMSEIKREEVLAERAQEVERRNQQSQLRRLIESKKRKAEKADLDDSPRKNIRPKVKAANENLEAYKRQREQKNQQRRHNEHRRNNEQGSLSPARGQSDADADGDSDTVEWDDRKKKHDKHTHNEPEPDLIEFNRIRVGRSNFARVCFYPGFDETITGCYCRVFVSKEGQRRQDQKYQMGQIKRFVTGKPYAMEGPNGKPFHTNQYIVLAVGKSEREWPFLTMSDSKFTEAELEAYKITANADNIRLPTKQFIHAKTQAIDSLLNRSWTDQELEEKLRRAGVIQQKSAALNRITLNAQRGSALNRGDEVELARIDKELVALDGPKLAFGTSMHSAAAKAGASKSRATQDRIAIINATNRKANRENVRKALIAEQKAERENQAKIARGEAVANPFARVKTKARTHFNDAENLPKISSKQIDELFGEGSDTSRAATPSAPAKNGSTSAQVESGSKKFERSTGLQTVKKRLMDDDIIASLDFGIDVDI